MTTFVKDVQFSCNKSMNTTIKRKLLASGLSTLERISDLEYWELFKLHSFGILKCLLVEHALAEKNLTFKGGWVIPRQYKTKKYTEALFKHI